MSDTTKLRIRARPVPLSDVFQDCKQNLLCYVPVETRADNTIG